MRETPAHRIQFIAKRTFPLAAPQGEKRAATSKTRHRRSDTSGTRSIVRVKIAVRRVPEVSLHRRPAHARRGSFLTRRPPRRVRAIQLSVTPLTIALSCVASVARRAARQPTAWPSARPTGAVAAHTLPLHVLLPKDPLSRPVNFRSWCDRI